MIRVEPFTVDHLRRLDLQDAQQYLAPHVNWDDMKYLCGDGAFAMVDGDEVVACYGLLPVTAQRAVTWAFLGNAAGKHMLRLTRSAKAVMACSPFPRIEALVDVEFEAAHRWVRLLGFQLETPRKRAYRVDGGDSAEYVLVR